MNINVKNINDKEIVIDIEGVIGVDEQLQFDEQREQPRVATFEKFREEIEKFSDVDYTSVRVNIRSMGGAVQDALLIYSWLTSLSEGVTVKTYCYGFSASAATISAQAASSGGRYVASSALYMIHCTSTEFDGNAAQATSMVEILEKTDRTIAEIYAARSGKSVEHFLEIMSRDGGQGEWLTAEEAVENGLADKVENTSSIKNIISSLKNFFGKIMTPKKEETEVENSEKIVPIQQLVATEQKTTTEAKEDPEIDHYSVALSNNNSSYTKDVKLFRGR